jgi:hypothetical protein
LYGSIFSSSRSKPYSALRIATIEQMEFKLDLKTIGAVNFHLGQRYRKYLRQPGKSLRE